MIDARINTVSLKVSVMIGARINTVSLKVSVMIGARINSLSKGFGDDMCKDQQSL